MDAIALKTQDKTFAIIVHLAGLMTFMARATGYLSD